MSRLVAGTLQFGVVFFGLVAAPRLSLGQEIDIRPLEFSHSDEIVRGTGFAVIADRRTFAVTAFLNAVGYDEEAEGVEMHPVRRRVRDLVAANLRGIPDRLSGWREFYVEAGLPTFVYLDFALSLSGDHPFQRIRPREEVGYPGALESLDDLIPLLNDFWVESDLESVWEAAKPQYMEELEQYDFVKMEEQMHELWSSLRLPRRDTYTIINVPNLLAQYYLGIGAEYETYYYTVETPGAQSYALNTHEYLHSIVNPLAEQAFGAQEEKLSRYYEAGREGQYAASYQHAPAFVSECLVRALDYRLRLRAAEGEESVEAIRTRVDDLTEGGLSLVRPLFEGLGAFELEQQDFSEYLPTLFAMLPTPASRLSSPRSP